MRLLLDTHSLLWWLGELPQLGPVARAEISKPGATVYVSAVSSAEISIKQAVGKLQAPSDLAGQLVVNGFTELPFTIAHGLAVAKLPLHHRDPFDRMLIAQAQTEGLTLVTADRQIAGYDISVLPTS